jgi:hypothetical protein
MLTTETLVCIILITGSARQIIESVSSSATVYFNNLGVITMTYRQALQLLNVKREQTTYQLNYLCTCTTDYFQGSSKPIVQVLVDENSTFQDIKANLLEYIATCHLEDLDAEAYERAVNEFFIAIENKYKSKLRIQPPIPEVLESVGSMEEQDEWDLYMYFTLETVGEDNV